MDNRANQSQQNVEYADVAGNRDGGPLFSHRQYANGCLSNRAIHSRTCRHFLGAAVVFHTPSTGSVADAVDQRGSHLHSGVSRGRRRQYQCGLDVGFVRALATGFWPARFIDLDGTAKSTNTSQLF